MFEPQLGKSIEVYIDDMIVKNKVVSEHMRDLGDIFEILRKTQIVPQRFQMFIWGWIRQILRLHNNLQGN